MIECIYGFNGSGKGLFATQKIIEILVSWEHVIVTNHPLRLENLQNYLDKHYPEKKILVRDRVRILDEDECHQYYLRLPHGYDAQEATPEQRLKNIRVDFDVCKRVKFEWGPEDMPEQVRSVDLPPAIWIIDEAWAFFPARDYSDARKLSPHHSWYLNQHRKTDADIIFITPAPEDLDTIVRNKVRIWHGMRNLGEEKEGIALIKFSKPKLFMRYTFNGYPRPSASPQETPFKIDLEQANCYDTEKGVGMVGRKGADKGRTLSKGVPWQVIPAALIVAAIVFWYAGDGAAWAVNTMTNPPKRARPGATNAFKPALEVAPVQVSVRGATNSELGSTMLKTHAPRSYKLDESKMPASELRSEVWLSGVVVLGGRYHVYLSDGREYVAGEDSEVINVYADKVLIVDEDGEQRLFSKRKLDPLFKASVPVPRQ